MLYLYTAGVDYTVFNDQVFNVTIPAGSTSSSFDVGIINEMTHVDEDNGMFTITIKLLPSSLPLSLGISSSTVILGGSSGSGTEFWWTHK